MRCVEKWEDDYKQAISWGMTPLVDLHKITILEDIATEKLREKLEDEQYTTYAEAMARLMKWARKKALRSDETKKKPVNPNAMDVDSGGAKALGERYWQSSSRPYTKESQREEADWYGWQGHVDVFGKGYNGKGKGSGEKRYQSQYNKGKGKGDGKSRAKGKGSGKNSIFWGECHHCGVMGHSASRCPEKGQGFKGNCHSCGLKGHTAAQCPKFSKGKGEGGINSMGEGQWWEKEGDEWEHTHSPTEDKGEKEEEEERPLKSLTLGSKTEREIENDFATLSKGGKPTNRNVRFQTQGQKGRLGALRILTEKDLKEWKQRNEENMTGKWEVIEGVVDSGAVDTVTNKSTAKFIPIHETRRSKRGAFWTTADGNHVYNEGEKFMRVSPGKAHQRACQCR